MANSPFDVPTVYQDFRDAWAYDHERLVKAYTQGRASFVPNLLPELAMQMPAEEALRILRGRLGERVDLALDHADPDDAAPPPDALRSPVAGLHDGSWLSRSNVVGINVRTIGSFWDVVKYALTIPAAQDAIHLLPIWEPGVVASLYGISSWNLNAEFFSPELAEACPWLGTVDRQLKAVVHLLHALGKAVGMEVIPHTDRYSEIVLANPGLFEWLQREGPELVDHSENLHEQVQARILAWLEKEGPAVAEEQFPQASEAFFAETFSEERRLRVLFGPAAEAELRLRRRLDLVRTLHSYGYETAPSTMAPPYRGLEVNPETRSVDSAGNVWYDYRITHPWPMSRVFGPLTRYKLYGCVDNNRNWEVDFSLPRHQVWSYVCSHYADVQRRFGFDFMRGDMSHVQMRPSGVPAVVDEYYDLLRAVKRHVQVERGIPHFAYLAETFLAGRNVMLYGDEVDHLEASEADATLGDLQSSVVGSPVFLQRLCQYRGILETRQVAPCFTLMTGDKDDPRFDEYYRKGNAVRLFLGLFLVDMPSYMALGFETREPHYQPAPNEHYTKLYVFQDVGGPKGTQGPYVWGKNGSLFHRLTRIRLYADEVLPQLQGRRTRWLIHPDPTGDAKHLAWTQAGSGPEWVFVANTGTEAPVEGFYIPRMGVAGDALELEFSTADAVLPVDQSLPVGRVGFKVTRLEAGEGRAYRCVGAKAV